MAEMTAKVYLAKVREICVIEDRAGRCDQTTKDTRGCPLWEFNCGLPDNKSKINAAIEAVKNYKF